MAGSARDFIIRGATQHDAEAMAHVEEAARALMQEQGISLDILEIPDDFTDPTDWDLGLVAEVDGHIVGMVRLTQLDSDLVALDQVSVHPSMSHQGIGRALLLATADLCRKRGYTAVTGTTFREVVFNAHFYAALGAIEDTHPHPAMAGRRRVEADIGLDALGPRTVMRVTL